MKHFVLRDIGKSIREEIVGSFLSQFHYLYTWLTTPGSTFSSPYADFCTYSAKISVSMKWTGGFFPKLFGPSTCGSQHTHRVWKCVVLWIVNKYSLCFSYKLNLGRKEWVEIVKHKVQWNWNSEGKKKPNSFIQE